MQVLSSFLCPFLWACLVAQSCPILCAPWTITHQAPLSMGSSRQECWSELPFPPPEDLPDPGIEPASPASPAFPALAGGFFTSEPPGKSWGGSKSAWPGAAGGCAPDPLHLGLQLDKDKKQSPVVQSPDGNKRQPSILDRIEK